MKILNISESHPFKTAGVVSYDFHKNMLFAGFESKILTLPYDDYQDENILSYYTWKYEQKIDRGLKKLLSIHKKKNAYNPNFYFDGFDLTITNYTTSSILKLLKGYRPDVIVIHFTQTFLSAKNIYELSVITGAPIYWYLMDMSPLTGGCAYSWDCKGYTDKCGSCPAIYSNKENDVSAKNLAYKKKYLSKSNIHVITASSPHYHQAKKSALFKNKPIHQLFLSIDDKIYRPLSSDNKRARRISYRIDPNKFVLFFGAVKISQKRKGLDILLEALKLLNTTLDNSIVSSMQLVIAGDFDECVKKVFLEEIVFDYVNLGFLNHTQLPDIFAIADCFICSSIEDSGPMMINQSIMTGTPVVSFSIGVANDLVMDRKTGFIATQKTPQDLCDAITRMVKTTKEERSNMSIQCRKIGLEKLSYNAQRNQFIEIIKNPKLSVD